MRIPLLVAVTLFSINHTAAASPEQPAAVDCNNATTTLAMQRCAAHEYQAADAELNWQYQQHKKILDKPAQQLLRDTQRAWITYRDQECQRQADSVRGGSMAPLLELGCKTQLTQQRTLELVPLSFEAATDPILWFPTMVTDRFNCQQPQTARVGLILKPGEPLIARLQIGQQKLDFPIATDTQNSLCGTTLRLSSQPLDQQCSELRLDDGMCDAMLIRWDPQQKRLRWERN